MLVKYPTSRTTACSPLQRPHCITRSRNQRRQVATHSSLCPYRTLGVTENADEQEIKKAYRKLALQYHPDVAKTEEAERKFISIQEAYYILSGKARGKETAGSRSSTSSGQWDFHDWFWQFRMNRTWDRQKAGGPSAAAGAASTFRPEETKEAIRTQLAGLRHRAAIRRVQKMNATMDSMDEESSDADAEPAAAQPAAAPDAFVEAADVADGANYTNNAAAAAADSSQAQPKPQFHMGEERRMHVSSQLAGLKRKGAFKKQYST